MKKALLFLFIAGFILRLYLSLQGYSGDVNNHISWGKDILLNGTQGIYDREFYFRYGTLTPNYPPLVLFFFTVSYVLYEMLYAASWWLNNNISLFPSNIIFFFQGINTIPAFFKLPAIFADLGIAYYVYLFSKKLVKSEKWRLISVSLVLFNPAFFYNSALWGQVEALPTLFAVAAFYVLLYSQRIYLSVVLFALALLSKQNAVIFAPIFLLVFWKNYSVVKMLKSGAVLLLFFWILFLPFNKQSSSLHNGNFLSFPFETYWNKILTNSVSDYVTYHAFNFWTLFVGQEKVHDFTPLFLGISFKIVGYLLFAGALILTLMKLLKHKIGTYMTLYSAVIISFASFLFITRLHERHLGSVLPFLLLLSVKEKKFLPIFLFVSIFHLANLYHDWWLPRIDSIVRLISQPLLINSGVLLLLASFLYLFTNFLSTRKNV